MKYTLRDIKHPFQPFISYTPDLFSYTLIVCLILFVLENILPGFVSDTFNPNLLLIPVIALGITSAFASEKKEKHDSPASKDLVMAGAMTILVGVIIYSTTKGIGWVGLVISVVGAVLVLIVAIALLFASKENEKIVGDDTFYFVQPKHKAKEHTGTLWSDKWRVALAGVLLAELALGFFVLRYIQISQKGQASQPTNNEVRLTVTPSEAIRIFKPDKNTLDQTPLTLINGGLGNQNIIELAKELTAYGITIQTTSEANQQNYTEGTLYFRPEDEAVADFLSSILQPTYPSIIKLPLSSSASGIILVVGKPEGTQ